MRHGPLSVICRLTFGSTLYHRFIARDTTTTEGEKLYIYTPLLCCRTDGPNVIQYNVASLKLLEAADVQSDIDSSLWIEMFTSQYNGSFNHIPRNAKAALAKERGEEEVQAE